MTAQDRWRQGQQGTTFQVRLTAEQEAKVRQLSHEFALPVSTVIRDLMIDGLIVLERRIQL